MRPHPSLTTLAMASVRRFGDARWFVWVPAPRRAIANPNPWVISSFGAPRWLA